MRTLLQNGIGMAVIGLLLCYFTIYAPLQQMAQGKPDVSVSLVMPMIGPFFCIGGLGLVLATLISRSRRADFSGNLFQQSRLHRWIVIVGMLAGLALGIYVGAVFVPRQQAEYGYAIGG